MTLGESLVPLEAPFILSRVWQWPPHSNAEPLERPEAELGQRLWPSRLTWGPGLSRPVFVERLGAVMHAWWEKGKV